MADKRITDMGAPTGGPASGDKLPLVDISDTSENAAGSSRADTITNVVTKGHGLSDGIVKVASGTMGIATAGTDYYAPGSTDVAVVDGGTGASDAATARTNLGLAIGTDVQAYDADLADIAGITPSQGDIIYRNASNWVRLAAGTSGQFLQTAGAGANPAWASGALTSFDAIVAASGGNYTTLGAAITAASAGWRILVLDNTTESGAISTALNNLYITGVSRTASVVNLGANDIHFSGTGVTVENLGFNVSNGASRVRSSGANNHFHRIRFDLVSSTPNGSSAGDKHLISGDYSLVSECEYVTTSTGAGTAHYLSLGGVGSKAVNNHFRMSYGGSTYTTQAGVKLNGASVSFIGNYLYTNALSTDCCLIYVSTDYTSVIANTIYASSTSVSYNAIIVGGTGTNVSGNMIRCGNKGIDVFNSNCTVTGNTIILGDTASATGIYLYSNNNITCTGNTVTTTDSTKAGSGIKLGSDYHVVSGNTVRGFTTGIEIASGADYNSVTGNNLTNNTTQITDAGVATTIENQFTDVNQEKRYRYLKNTSGGAVAVGDLLVYKSVAAGDEVTTTTTGGDSKVIGMAAEAVANNTYLMVQTLGKTTSLKVDGTTDIAVGDFISTFTTAAIGQKASAGQTAIAIALEAYATNDSNGVIDALIITPRII